jgi:hypothetical protein
MAERLLRVNVREIESLRIKPAEGQINEQPLRYFAQYDKTPIIGLDEATTMLAKAIEYLSSHDTAVTFVVVDP